MALPPYRGGPIEEYLRELSQQPAIQAERIDATMADAAGGGQTYADIEHGLGRAYKDAWLGSQSSGTVDLRVMSAEAAEGLGVDVSRYVRVYASASSTSLFTLWVL